MVRRERATSKPRKARRTSVSTVAALTGAPSKPRRATRTPTEIGQTVPRTPAEERAKTRALKATSKRRKAPAKARKAARAYGRVVERERERVLREALRARGDRDLPVARELEEGEREVQRAVARFRGQETYKPREDPVIDELAAMAPTGIKIVRALAGDEPGNAGLPSLGEITSAGATIAGGGAGALARVAAAGRAVSKVAAAEKARKAATTTRTAKATAAMKASLKKTGKAAPTATRAPTKAEKAKAAGRVAKERAKTRYAAPERKVRRARRTERATVRAVNPITGVAATSDTGRALAEGTAKAITESPGKTAATTLRAAYGFPAAVVGDVVDLATGHPGKFLESQAEYLKSLKPLVSGDPEAVQKAIEENVGLIPHATVALGVYAAGRATSKATGKEPRLPSASRARLGRDVRTAREGTTRAEREAAEDRLRAARYGEPLVEAHRGRKRSSEEASTFGELESAMRAQEMRKGGKRKKTGRRSTVPNELRALSRRQINEDVTEADVVMFMGRHQFRPDDIEAVRAVRESYTEPSRPLPENKLHPRRVADAILDNPAVLRNQRVRRLINEQLKAVEIGQSIERHSERTGKRQTTPDPMDVIPRLMPVMREFDIRTDWERIPAELRGTTKVKETRGHDAERAIRGEAKNLLNRAKRLEAQAASQRRARPERAQVLDDRAARYRAEAQGRLDVVDRFKRERSRKIEAVRAEDTGDVAKAAALRAEARELRERAEADQALRRREAIGETRRELKKRGREEPLFFSEADVARMKEEATTGVNRQGRKEKHRKGVLEEQGRINESALQLLENLYAGRKSLTERERERSLLDDPVRVDGERFLTNDEFTAGRMTGELGPGIRKVPATDFSVTIQRSGPLRTEYEAKKIVADARKPAGDRRLYLALPRARHTEFVKQTERLGGGMRGLRMASRGQAVVMLGTSTQWAGMQLVATPILVGMRNPNPLVHLRASRMAIKIWRDASPAERAAFRARFGANPADFLAIGENVRGIGAEATAIDIKAARLAFQSPVGRMVKAIGENVRKGGPLIAFNRRYEAAWRTYEALLEMDRLSGLKPNGKTRLFAQAVSQVTDTVYLHLNELQGKNAAEQVRFYLDNPKRMRELEDQVNRAYGNWASLTAFEKKLSSVIVFYPFLRFSLGYLAKFPRDNPVKTAIYLNLAQQNAQELSNLLGGRPSFWTGWAQAVHHAGGEPDLIDLSRAVPGGNVLIESLGGGTNLIQGALRGVQPLIGGTVAAAYGKDPFGREAKGSFAEQIALNTASLSPLTRGLKDAIASPSEISELFRAIEDRSGLERAFLPDVFPDVEREAEAARVGRLLETAFNSPTDEEKQATPYGTPERQALNAREKASDKAWDAINELLRQYEIETKAEQRKEFKQYGHRVLGYGRTSPSTEEPFGGGADLGGSGEFGGGAF